MCLLGQSRLSGRRNVLVPSLGVLLRKDGCSRTVMILESGFGRRKVASV